MKQLLLLCLLGASTLGWAHQPSVVSVPSVTGRHENSESDDDKKDSRKPPFKGMTKAQARHFYGDPDSVGHRDGQELWTYVLNRGSVIAHSFIPFDYSNKFRYRLLTFQGDKVVDFRWDKPE